MVISRGRILSFCLLLSFSSAPHAILAAESRQQRPNARDMVAFMDPEKIAIDPILLKMEDLRGSELDNLAPIPTDRTKQLTHGSLVPATTTNILPSSELEKLYSERLREPMSQFGYDLFPSEAHMPAGGAVQESYILESGDEVNVLLRGGQSSNITTTISDDGTLVIDTLPPINAAGKSLKAVRAELLALTKDVYNTELFLSVSKTRKLTVTVSGNVNQPGQVTLSTYNTLLDALGAVGGVKKT